MNADELTLLKMQLTRAQNVVITFEQMSVLLNITAEYENNSNAAIVEAHHAAIDMVSNLEATVAQVELAINASH